MKTVGLFAVLVLIFGSGPYAISVQLGPVAPELLVGYRFGASGILLMALTLVLGRSLRFGIRDHLYLALQGLLMFSAIDLLLYFAVPRIPGGLVQLMMSMMIVTNVVFAAAFLGLPVRTRVVVGGLLGIVGIAMVSWPEIRAIELAGAGLSGLAAAYLGLLAASLGITATARNQRAGMPVLESTGIAMVYGAGCSFIVAAAFGRSLAWDWSPAFLGGFAWISIVMSAVGMVMFFHLIGRLGPDRAAYVILLTPITALAISTAQGDFAWTALSLVGVATVLVGNVVVLTKLERRPIAEVGGG
jgi:drug/metabolite transporter (DMT)-like permease